MWRRNPPQNHELHMQKKPKTQQFKSCVMLHRLGMFVDEDAAGRDVKFAVSFVQLVPVLVLSVLVGVRRVAVRGWG